MLGRVHQAQQAGVAHLAQHLARHHALALPGLGVRLHLAREEAGDLLAQQFVFRGVVDLLLHGGRLHILNTPNFGLSGMGAFRLALIASASTRRVSAGSITPSSHSRALEK